MVRSLAIVLGGVMVLAVAAAATPAGRAWLQPQLPAQVQVVTAIPDDAPAQAFAAPAVAARPAPRRPAAPRIIRASMPPGAVRPPAGPGPAPIPAAAVATVLRSLPEVMSGGGGALPVLNGGASGAATPCAAVPGGPAVQDLCGAVLSGALPPGH